MFHKTSFPLRILLGALLFCWFALPLLPQVAINSPSVTGMTVRAEVHHDVSLPLRDMPTITPPISFLHEAEPVRLLPLRPGFKPPEAPDSVHQRTAAIAPAGLAPTVNLGFDGLGNGSLGFTVNSAPPDTNGAVGSTQYVQWVNTSFAVFNKSTGALIAGPTAGNTLWSGFGGGCQTNNDGDPIVLYDKLANRWVFSQFSVSTTPFLQCIAVSTTSDATGTYNRYSFQYSNFDDYPKMGVWPDGYYETFNMFNGTTNAFVGADLCAYDRNAMLNGQPATQVCFQQNSSIGGVLPADLDGTTAPPSGSPNYMLFFGTNNLNLFKFHVNFATPSASTLTGPTAIPVAAFTPLCNGGTCVPQPGTTQQLDSLADRLMYRLAYRNLGSHESLVVNHSVVAGSSGGIRWYEIQNPNGTPTVAQQSTFAPDSNFRWMGSIAMDQAGDIAVGYSVSSSSVNPSVRFTGRTPSDPTSTMEAETNIVSGSGSQNGNLSRWGDYSAMTVDPVDDCTFWYTQEYMKTTGSFNWNTRIANFKFPNCGGTPDFSLSASPASVTITQGNSGTSTITVTPSGGFTGSVTLSASGLPAGVTASFGTNPTTSTSVLTLTASSTATTGTATVTVTGTSGTLTHTTTITLTVNAPAAPDFTLSASPGSLTIIQGNSGSSTITVNPLNGFTGSVTLSNSALPSGVTASFGTNPTTSTSVLTFTASSTATTGTSTITITGTSGSLTHTTTISLTISSNAPQQLLGNPGFENGTNTAPWTLTAGVINNSSAEPPHSGAWDAWLDGYGTTHTDSATQTVTIPSTATTATLSFWLHIDTAETTTTTAFDTLQVQVLNTSNTVLATLGTFSNLNAATGYQQHSFSVIQFKGQTIKIRFLGKEDVSLQTSFVIDDTA
ncbi:MAG TPA: hypothetical protein VKE71_00700, partial [Candidatus Angelobacter sp.]|nr:hypothetical protein [Candidatus Angelobacter sp.]